MPEPVPISRKMFDEQGLDRAAYYSCSAPDGNRNKGCVEYHRCKLKERLDGAGPVNKGVRLLKTSPVTQRTTVSHTSMSCYHIPHRASELAKNDGALVVIASEGETIKCRGSVFRDETIPGQGLVRIIEDKNLDIVVPAYKDEDSVDLLERSLASQMLVEAEADNETERIKELERAAAGPAKPGAGRKG